MLIYNILLYILVKQQRQAVRITSSHAASVSRHWNWILASMRKQCIVSRSDESNMARKELW